VLVTVI